jgi:hypothetical protein
VSVGEAARDLRDVLDREGVRWYVFGAQAVLVHGIARTTQDLDVTVLVPPRGAASLAASLVEAGFEHRFPERSDELIARAAVIPMKHRASGLDVDIVLGGSGLEALVQGAAERRELDGVLVPVASATHLVVMKVVAGRGKDLDDVQGLLASGGVDRHEVRALLSQLEEALDQSDLLPIFEALVRSEPAP